MNAVVSELPHRRGAARPTAATLPLPAEDQPTSLKLTLGYSHPQGVGVTALPVVLRNGRLYQGFGLDHTGFDFIAHAPALERWSDYQSADVVTSVVYPEVETALTAASGASRVLVYEHRLHSSGVGALGPTWSSLPPVAPAETVPSLVKRLLPPGEGAWRLTRRHALVQFWRPVEAPVRHWPLAVCEAASIEMADRVVDPTGAAGWSALHSTLAPNLSHRWYWLPQQDEHEATLVKLFDSAPGGADQVSALAVFRHPAASGQVSLPEHRIEVRALLFW